MPTVAEQLNNVVEKTERLIELYSAMQEENDLLKLENQTLSSALKSSKEKSQELEEKLRILKMAKSFSETNEKTLDIKQKLTNLCRK